MFRQFCGLLQVGQGQPQNFRQMFCLLRSNLKTNSNIYPSLSSSFWTSGVTSEANGETKLISILKEKFPRASTVEVKDVSGGCGAMYEVWIEANDFKGLSTVKQHKLVTQALKDEIKEMHGLRISTSVPDGS